MKKITLFTLVLTPFVVFLISYAVAYFFFQKSYVSVPSLLGKSVRDGAVLLGQQGLFLAVLKEQEDPLVKDGTIVHQLPFSGQQSKFQKPVYVTVIKNTETKRAPAFFGLGLSDIEELAKKTKLKPTVVTLSTAYSRGVCFAQVPLPGEPALDGTVTLYVAQGCHQWRMVPDVRGLAYEEAVAQLVKVGITYELFNVHDEAELSLPEMHKIVDQRPRPGVFVNAEKVVHLQIQVE